MLILGVPGVGILQQVEVQTRLAGGLLWLVVGAEPELKEAHVVCGQLHPDLDDLIPLVLAGDHALAVHAAGLVVARLLSKYNYYFYTNTILS